MSDFKHQEGLLLEQILITFSLIYRTQKDMLSLFLSLNLQLVDSNRITEERIQSKGINLLSCEMF